MNLSIDEINTYYKVQDNSSIAINKCTCQFLIFENDSPKALGTGVLIKVNEDYFIITAAHVIENYEEKLFIRSSQNMISRIEFELSMSKPSNERKDDKTDIATLKLYEQTIEELNGYYDFLNSNELGINHELQSLPVYMAFGYPCSLTRIKYKQNALTSKPTYITTKLADNATYSKLECKIDKNLIIGFNKNNLVNGNTKKNETAPDLYGMSGCGLWHIPMQTLNPNQKIKKTLVAILTEWPVKNRKYIICTRVDVVSEILRITYNLQLPFSNVFQSTIIIE